MATLSFKRAFQALLPAVFAGGSLFSAMNGPVTIALVEGLSRRSPLGCVFHWLTELDCPGCGMTRSLLALILGQVDLAFYFNPLGPLVALAICATWLFSFERFAGSRVAEHLTKWSRRHGWSVLILVVAWGVLRNVLNT